MKENQFPTLNGAPAQAFTDEEQKVENLANVDSLTEDELAAVSGGDLSGIAAVVGAAGLGGYAVGRTLGRVLWNGDRYSDQCE